MPRARRKAASPEPVETHDEPMQEPTNGLRLNEPLTWRAGKPIPVSDLLVRLKRLAEELGSIQQEDADRESLVPKAQELASPQLLAHRDKGVKAWTMVCVVEMFRLLAPDAPYKEGQLKQIFDIFVSTIVPSLANPTEPYMQQYLAVLASLTNIKSIILLSDIPGSDHLLLDLFNNCFDVMSGSAREGHGETLPKNVEYHMTNMLCTLVDECEALPTGVTDIILAQFLRADPHAMSMGKKGETQPSTLLRELSPAHNMARSVCNTCADKMTRLVGQYFSSVLMDASETVAASKASKPKGRKRTRDESDDEDSDEGLLTPPAESDFEEVEKAHRLLRELWRSSPDVVQTIVPQMEAEMSAENVQLRTMAIQTVGDMVSGIGAAGPPAPMPMDPSAYPSHSLDTTPTLVQYQNVMNAPAAPHAFSAVYPHIYQGFVDRHRDKSAQVRCVWATAAGRIISTSGGGKGLDVEQESRLLRHFSDMLQDNDERVRLCAVRAVAQFDFHAIVQHLGGAGGVSSPGSPLCVLADRIKDRKHTVRVEAMELLARVWGVAAGAIEEGSERLREMLGPIPSKIMMAYYVNNIETTMLIQRVLYSFLLPLGYPPIKKSAVTDSQRVQDSQTASFTLEKPLDPDSIRAERILVLFRDLDEKDLKDRKVFIHFQKTQAANAKYLEAYLKASSEYNDSVTKGKDDQKAKLKTLDTLIAAISKMTPDPNLATEHLKKVAKHDDRRSYQLIRFCFDPKSDYRKIVNASKELAKRLASASTEISVTLQTLEPIVQSASVLVYNRSHVPAIMDIARTDKKGLGVAAHDMLKEISSQAPEVFKVHVRELCDELTRQAPSASSPNEAGAVDTLKACAGFAQRYPDDMPEDRDFYEAMVAFAKHGTPPEAAKHAVNVIASSKKRKEMYIQNVLKHCLKDFQFGADSFLSRLAAISQLRLVAYQETKQHTDAVMAIAVGDVLGEVRTHRDGDADVWTKDIDDDLCAKLWALKILVNGLRGMTTNSNPLEDQAAIASEAEKVYRLLNTLIEKDGELSNSGTATTPKHHAAHLRLTAAKQILKLSCNKAIDQFLTPADFNRLAKVTQDVLPEVRAGFNECLKKYLGQGKLHTRFYALVFVYAFEPSAAIKGSTITWLKGCAARYAKTNDTTMETVFARLLSLLAHHPDFSRETKDLTDFVEFILFYLKNVATEANLPLIYHMAQRVKSVQDGIDPEKSDDLYTMSDLAEAVIRLFQEHHHWSLQLYPGKARLPSGIFAALPSHTLAQEIAEKRYIPEDLAEDLEDIVKDSLKSKKRKLDGAATKPPAKKARPSVNGTTKKLPVRKAPKATKPSKQKKTADAVPSSERRKSARASNAKSYVEEDSDEDDEEENWDDGAEEAEEEESAEEGAPSESTPPTSNPPPAKPARAPSSSARKGRKEAAPSKSPAAAKAAVTKTTRSTRATGRAAKSKGKVVEKGVFDVPGDSDEELSDVPDDVDV